MVGPVILKKIVHISRRTVGAEQLSHVMLSAGMDQVTAQALADGYAAYIAGGDLSVLAMFSPEFHDHVSGQRGLHIFTVVSGWLAESFAERSSSCTSSRIPMAPSWRGTQC